MKSILSASALVAMAVSVAGAESAKTRRVESAQVELPEGVVEMVIEAKDWRPKWRWPVPKPPVPAPPVLYGRETALPLCRWGYYEDEGSFWQFITDGHGYLDWTCKAVGGGPNDDTCSFGGAPDYKPTDASYFLAPRDQADHYTQNLEWADGSALFGVWYLKCASSGAGAGPDDIVASTDIEGMYTGHVLGYVAGGVVEHVRPAYVRGTVSIVLPPGNYLPRQENDLTLAIQVLGDNGWEDVATSVHTVEKTLYSFEVAATVPELVDVRLAVRADASRGHLGVGYDLRDARIFVETCIPNQNEPGTCLGD